MLSGQHIGPFGAGVFGGVSALWGDQLGDRQIFGALQANGTVKDIGGAVQYYNLRDRWNWGAGAQQKRLAIVLVFLQRLVNLCGGALRVATLQ